ncbi:unnamed protein product [Mycena citricolor]|uniref:CCHC-type domain-containing protein n=1 Tax=Mycena citricolor TaxID=2018698 RepID=A0AAD2HKN0_9AGAR|nr:unnamed protein product [Mycena citricolor]CAK5283473.1 unnamed protein product [Mycena citricolor]
MADTITANAFRIEPLAGSSNYGAWKVQMMDILTEQNLDDHVDDSVTPPDDSEASKKKVWIKNDRRALSSIRLRVAPAVVQHVQGETTALGAWQMLSHLFELKGQMGLVLARHKFYSTRANPEEPLEPHIKLMRQIQGELTSLGHTVDDADFAVTLLSSLSSQWDSFIRAALASPTAPTSKTTISSILTEEARRNNHPADAGEIALTVRTATRHINRFVPKNHAITPSNSHTRPANSATCHKCGGRGHFARVCPTRDSDDKEGESNQNGAHFFTESDLVDNDDDYAF